MSSTTIITTHCDEENCAAEYTARLGERLPQDWQHIPGTSMKRYYLGTKSKDYCPEHNHR